MFKASFLAFAAFMFQSQAFAQVGELTLQPVGRSAFCEVAEDKGNKAFTMHAPSVKRTPLGIIIGVSTTIYTCASSGDDGMAWKVTGSLPNQYLVAELWRGTSLVARKGGMSGMMRARSTSSKNAQRGQTEFSSDDVFSPSENEMIIHGKGVVKRFDLSLGQVTMQNYYQVSPGMFWLTIEFLGNGDSRIKSFAAAR